MCTYFTKGSRPQLVEEKAYVSQSLDSLISISVITIRGTKAARAYGIQFPAEWSVLGCVNSLPRPEDLGREITQPVVLAIQLGMYVAPAEL